MRNTYQHPVITRLMAFGLEYDEVPPRFCAACGRELLPEDRDFFGDYPEICWECEHGEEETDGT